MPFTFLPTLPSIFHRIHRMFQPTQNLACREIPPAGTVVDIDLFLQMLKDHYSLLGMAHMQAFQVSEITILKERSSSEHEYLRAKISSSSGAVFYLSIERVPGDRSSAPSSTNTPLDSGSETSLSLPNVKRMIKKKLSQASIASTTSTTSSTDPSLKSREARDLVAFLPCKKRNAGDKECLVLSFGPSSPSSAPTSSASISPKTLHLYCLIVIACTIHHHHATYKIFGDNCYFFAGAVFGLVKKLYQPVQTELESGAGSWRFVSLFPPGEDKFDAEGLKDEVLKNLDMFETLVSSWALGNEPYLFWPSDKTV
jgi:hypothetical protein